MAQLTSIRRRPSSMLRSFQQEVNDLFGDFFGTAERPATHGRTKLATAFG